MEAPRQHQARDLGRPETSRATRLPAHWALLTHPSSWRWCARQSQNGSTCFEEYARWIAPIGMSRAASRDCVVRGVDSSLTIAFFMFGSATATRPALRSRPFRYHPRYRQEHRVRRRPALLARRFASAPWSPMWPPGIFAQLKGLRLDERAPVRIAAGRFAACSICRQMDA